MIFIQQNENEIRIDLLLGLVSLVLSGGVASTVGTLIGIGVLVLLLAIAYLIYIGKYVPIFIFC